MNLEIVNILFSVEFPIVVTEVCILSVKALILYKEHTIKAESYSFKE